MNLPNGCSVSKISVYPKNWKTIRASVKIDWYIHYYFKDPNFSAEKPYGKLVIVKGMNTTKCLQERREITERVLLEETRSLLSGYNCFLGKKIEELPQNTYEIDPKTPFIKALKMALEKTTCVPATKLDIKSTLKYVSISAEKLHYDYMYISEIRRKHIKAILDHCGATKKVWSANTYNAYRKNLSILFSILVEMEAIEFNPTTQISKQKTIRKIRKILTPEECFKVNEFAKKYDHRFWLLINIFFHSGCRTTEIFRVQGKHVHLHRQVVEMLILKGGNYYWTEKPIKNIAVEFWKEALQDCGPDDFVFGKELKPNPVAIHPRQACRRWKKHIKGKLKIVCDWYSLKYLNTDQIAQARGLKLAGYLNNHTNERTTRIYAVGEDARMREEIRQMGNTFVADSGM